VGVDRALRHARHSSCSPTARIREVTRDSSTSSGGCSRAI
jgi:hypothetical protein